MTSEAAAIALEYAGEDIQDQDLGIFLEIVHGLNETPEVRGVDTVVPGAPGRVAGSRVFDRFTIHLEGWVTGGASGGAAAFRANMAFLQSLFSPTRTPATLRAVLEDASVAEVTARPLSIAGGAQPVPDALPISVELEAIEPWAAGS